MSTILRKARKLGSKAVSVGRTVTNPVSIIENKAVNSVIPGYSKTVTDTLNPFSTLNQTIVRNVANPVNAINPLSPINIGRETVKQIAESAADKARASANQVRVIPDRSAYSESASKSAAAAAKAAKLAEQRENIAATKDAAAAAAQAASEANKNRAKWEAAQRAAAAENTPAVQQAEQANANGNETTAAQQAEQITSSTDTTALLNALLAAQGAGMSEYYLPEQEVKSDFFKYLALGGALLLGFYFVKKMK